MLKKSLLLMIIPLFTMIFSLNDANAEQPEGFNDSPYSNEEFQKSLDEGIELHNTLMSYTELDENNLYYFDEEKAKNDGLSPVDIEAGHHLINLKNQEILDENNDSEMIQPYALYRYGNYCGPGNSGGIPINAVDRTCMIHDNCYDSYGWGSCNCDINLISSMSNHITNGSLGAGERAFATAALAYFSGLYTAGACV